MSIFDAFDPGHAYKQAQTEREKYFQQMLQQLQPYNQNGLDAGNKMNEGMNALMDPTALENKWASSYEMSPYAKQSIDQSNANGMDAASQMGLLGSSSAMGNIQNTSHNLMQQDRGQYLQDLMQKYLAGTGLAQSMYGTGANAAGQMAQGTNQMGSDMSQLSYGKDAARNQMLMGLLGMGAGGGGKGGFGGGGSGGGFSGMGGGGGSGGGGIDISQIMKMMAMGGM